MNKKEKKVKWKGCVTIKDVFKKRKFNLKKAVKAAKKHLTKTHE
jgi:hypothetical protein